MLKNVILLLSLSLLLAACGSSGQENAGTDNKDTEDMSDFASEQEFKDAHDTPTDTRFEGKGKMISFATPDGEQGSAYAIMNDAATDDYLFIIHEWWGLNKNIKKEAEQLFNALDDVHVMALDLYDGKVAEDQETASQYMQSVEEARAKSIIKGAMQKAGKEARIATIGWCFGGGWSLKTAIMADKQAQGCVMYYGMPVQDKAQLADLDTDILGIFAKQDEWINPKVVADFKELSKETNTQLKVHSFDANHAFANPSQPSYNAEAAQRANKLALDYLKKAFQRQG